MTTRPREVNQLCAQARLLLMLWQHHE